MSKPDPDPLRVEPSAGEKPVLDYARPAGELGDQPAPGRSGPTTEHRTVAAVIGALTFTVVMWLGWKMAHAMPEYGGSQEKESVPAMCWATFVVGVLAAWIVYLIGLRAGGIFGEEPPEDEPPPEARLATAVRLVRQVPPDGRRWSDRIGPAIIAAGIFVLAVLVGASLVWWGLGLLFRHPTDWQSDPALWLLFAVPAACAAWIAAQAFRSAVHRVRNAGRQERRDRRRAAGNAVEAQRRRPQPSDDGPRAGAG